MPQKKHFGLKRRRETIATPSPRKKPRFSPRKLREERHHTREDRLESRKKDTKSNSILEVVGISKRDDGARSERPTHVEMERRDRSASEKENAPLKDSAVMAEPQLNGNCAAPSENLAATSPVIAAPVIPALEFPTLFSSRMYKRLYGKDRAPALIVDSAPPSGMIQSAAVDDRPKLAKGSSNQHPSPYSSTPVTPEDINIDLRMDDSYMSDGSLLSSNPFNHTPFPASCDKPQNFNDAAPSKVAQTEFKPEPHKYAEPSPKKLEESILQSLAVEPLPIRSMSPEKTKTISSKVNFEQSSAKSPIAKVGLLAVGKTRQQTVATIRPIQKLAAEETPAVVEKLDKNSLVALEPDSSIKNSPESKITEPNSRVRSAEKSSRHLKIPGLSGSAKGKTVRQVFAPISNQWNHSPPTAGNKNDNNKKESSEFSSVVKTVSMTSELSVRVDDLKEDELKRQLLFGSPVKWADDSVDSPITERPANACKLYSIFGSPCIDRSNSSEHPFSVPPGAYEDSCWTNPISEKVPTKSPAVEPDLQKQSKISLEPVTIAETEIKEKTLELNGAEKVTTASSICPPPSLSVIKKHVSIFSPVKDSRQSVTRKMPDEPSRSNTGICFPFTRPRYEDTVLGQFDDTALFVSALAEVDTKISPFSTPIKSGDESDHAQSITVEKNPTSFQQVFKKNFPEETQQNHEFPNPGNGTEAIIAEECPNLSAPAGTTNRSVLSRHSKENRETEDGSSLDPQPRKKTVEPPIITVTPPKTESSLRIIHRPNFASSTILSVKSWFPNAPVKMVTPRKTPRLVSSVSRSASPKSHEASAGARIAINDAFIIEQEERVRRWELDHLYENTVRSGSGSPFKSVNGSPMRKRIESSGKISPSKRSPKKRVSPCKSSRRAEHHRNLGVGHNQCPLGADTPVSNVATDSESAVNQPVPDSANQSGVDAFSFDVDSSRISAEPIKSLPNPAQKLLTMLNDIMSKTTRTEPGVDSSSADANKPEAKVAPMAVDSTSVSAKTQIEDENVVVDRNNSSNRVGPEPPTSTLEHEIVPSQVTVPDNIKSCTNAVEEKVCPKDETKEQVVLSVNSSDPAVLYPIPPPCTPLLFNDKTGRLPIEVTQGLKDITESSRKGSADTTMLPSSSSNVTSAKTSHTPLTDCSGPSTEVKTNKNRKQEKTVQNTNSPASVPIDPSKPSDSSDCHINAPSGDHAKSGPNGRTIPRPSKYAAIISRVKPCTPLNKSVAALLTSSINSVSSPSSTPRLTISTPIVQSAKKSHFKRSSALKPDTGKDAGNSLMNSIRSTFFQGTPSSSAKADNSGARMTPKHYIEPRRIRKNTPNLNVNSANEVTVQSTTHTTVAISSLNKNVVHPTTAESALLDGVGRSKAAMEAVVRRDVAHLRKPAVSEMKCNTPLQWKLIEVDPPTKPISLLQRFRELNENDALHCPLDSELKVQSDSPSSNLNPEVEKNAISSAAEPTVVKKGAKPKPGLEPKLVSSPVLSGVTERKCHAPSETPLLPKSGGGKVVNRDSAKHPKSPVFPRSSLRKTILLDCPPKMPTPTKGKKRSGESVESPKSDEKRVEPRSGETSRKRTASGGRVTSKTSNRKYAEPDRTSRNSPYTESRHSRRRRNASCEESSRKSRRTKRDRSPTPRLRRKSHSAYYNSPERSPDRAIKTSNKFHNKAKEPKSRSSRSSDRKSKSSKSSVRRCRITTLESVGGKSKIDSLEPSDRKCKISSSESAGKQSKKSSSETDDRGPKTSSSDSGYRSSKISSCESAGRNSHCMEIALPRNRGTNFSITSETNATEMIVLGKRPALFSPY